MGTFLSAVVQGGVSHLRDEEFPTVTGSAWASGTDDRDGGTGGWFQDRCVTRVNPDEAYGRVWGWDRGS